MPSISRLSSYFLSAVFLFAGIDKALHYQGFVNTLDSYRTVPEGTALYLALPLIVLEILVGLTLLVKSWRRPAAGLAGGLLLIFSIALAVQLKLAPGSDCGCWYSLTLGKTTAFHLLQNAILLALAWTVMAKSNESPAPPASDRQSPRMSHLESPDRAS